MSDAVMTITDDNFSAVVLEADRPVVVDFWAAWCPPCRVMDRVLAELAVERPDVRVVKLDVDANQRTGVQYGVLSMPTLLVFDRGQELLRLVGSRPKRRLVQELDAILAPLAGGTGAPA
ncbi:MAG TPA: thioredoxin [Solirubrobacteraceae bacterium]|nr:thioredoxin [Solirubrobacteraceae bacterium]